MTSSEKPEQLPALPASPCWAPSFVSDCGRVTLYNADCRDVLPTLAGIDAVITDPPYGVTACEWDTAPDMDQFWNQVNAVCLGKTIITATEPFATDVIISNRANFRWDDVWVKPPCGMLNKDRPLRAHERLLVFGRGPYTPVKSETGALLAKIGKTKLLNSKGEAEAYGQKNWTRDSWTETGEREAKSVVYFARKKNNQHTSENQHHPTEKPVGLMQYLVEMHTKDGDAVLDPYMGSGTTGIACIRTGRRFVGVEKDPTHYQTAVARIRAELAQGDLFLSPNALVSDPEPAASTSKVANPKDSLHQPVVLGMGSKTILPEGH